MSRGEQPAGPVPATPGVPPVEVDELATFARHRAWLAAPSVHLEVDPDRDLLLVSCYPGLPEVEIDPSSALSLGFHHHAGEYLLTSLALYGVAGWSGSDHVEVALARRLLGARISAAVAELSGGGQATLRLDAGQARELAERWCRFVAGTAGSADGWGTEFAPL